MSGDTSYPFETNLVGAYNCLELARRDDAQLVFLSTSRVYPYRGLYELRLERDRDALRARRRAGGGRARRRAGSPSASRSRARGPSTARPSSPPSCWSPSTRRTSGCATVIDRCGVIAGPWQMGKVDQGVFTFWLLHHHFERPLRYIGYGGSGKQVRDLLHVDDLVELIDEQSPIPSTGRPLATSAAVASAASRCSRRRRSVAS